MNPTENHFVLAGIAVFERQIYHLIKDVEKLVDELGLGPPEDVELHASVMAGGRRGVWRGIPRRQRLEMIEAGLGVLNKAHRSVHAFAVVLDKEHIGQDDPVERAFEEICNRFNLFLSRIRPSEHPPQKGLVVMDKSHYEETLQGLASRFRATGTRWGNLQNLAEVPMFVDSAATRLVQLADLLAWAVWRRYEHGDTKYLDLIVRRFDRTRRVIHGLVHLKNPGTDCMCPACFSRSRPARP